MELTSWGHLRCHHGSFHSSGLAIACSESMSAHRGQVGFGLRGWEEKVRVRMVADAQGIRQPDYFWEREIGCKGDRKLPQHPSKFLRGHPFSGVRHWEATCFPGPLLETKDKASFCGLEDFRCILPSACRSYMWEQTTIIYLIVFLLGLLNCYIISVCLRSTCYGQFTSYLKKSLQSNSQINHRNFIISVK